jgi:hypothetical protein
MIFVTHHSTRELGLLDNIRQSSQVTIRILIFITQLQIIWNTKVVFNSERYGTLETSKPK